MMGSVQASTKSAVLALFAVALAAGCAAVSGDEPIGSSEHAAQPIDRLIMGQAAKYPADKTLKEQAPLLESSMVARRRAAWAIVEKVLQPVPLATSALEDRSIRARATEADRERLEMPRFQTWYGREDVMPMFDRLFRALPDDAKRGHIPFSAGSVDAVFPWNATMATSLRSFTEERLAARRRELATPEGVASLGKDARVLMSPSYVSHLLRSYGKITGCTPTAANAANATETAPCLDGEFPEDSVAIKTRWIPSSMPVPTYDTSAASLAAKLKAGTFGAGDGQADPGPAKAYTMRLTPDTATRLVALHIMTKELKDWVWITLWWSPDANSDFGADRPASLTGTFANYKMCVATAYSEKDAAPGGAFSAQPTLADSMNAAAAAGGDGPATWCSNPYLETEERAATTNCIGCHQHGGTGETNNTILADEKRFPNFSRANTRKTFPSDYAFTMDGGLDIAAEMRFRMEALTPPAPEPLEPAPPPQP